MSCGIYPDLRDVEVCILVSETDVATTRPEQPGGTTCRPGVLAECLPVDYDHVSLESARPGEALIAVLTNKRLLARVQEVMFLHVGFLLKGPAARTASIRAGAG